MVIHSSSKPTATPWPALQPMGPLAGKPPIPLARPATLVGTRQTAHLRLNSSQVSKAHALILSSDSKVHIRDLNSRTKVFVNGKEVREADLREGDQVKIGRYTFQFTAGPKIQSGARRRMAPAAQLETDAGGVVALNQRVMVIGQRAGADLVIAGDAVSTTHAAIFDVNGRRYIMDLGSRNGTFVNGQKTLGVELKIGDVIEIGGNDVRYVGGGGAGAESGEADLDDVRALESLEEAPRPAKPSGKSKLFEPTDGLGDSNELLAVEEGVSLPEPEQVRMPMGGKAIPPTPEPEREAPRKNAKEVEAEKAAEDELMALLSEEPAEAVKKAEPEEEERIPLVEETVAEEPVAEEETIPVEEAAAAQALAIEEEKVAEVEAPPALEVEPEKQIVEEQGEEVEIVAAPEASVSVEREIIEEVAAGPAVAESAPPATATTNVEIIPEAVAEVTEEVKAAAMAFDSDELPVPAAEGQPVASEPPRAPVVEESIGATAASESEIDDFLEEPEELTAPAPEPIAVAPREPEAVAFAGPVAVFPTSDPADIPAPRPPRWITPAAHPDFKPTIVTIRSTHPPADFDLAELLGEKKSPFVDAGAALIQEAKAASPVMARPEIVPAEIDEKPVEEKPIEAAAAEVVAPPPVVIEEAPAAVEEAPAPPSPAAEEPDVDDLALLALEEAPEEAAAAPEPRPEPPEQVIPAASVEAEPAIELVEAPRAPEPQPAIATTSSAIVPQPGPAPTTATSVIAPADGDEDVLDLLEAPPDEVESAPESIPFAEVAARAPVRAAAAPVAADSTAPTRGAVAFSEVSEEPSARDVFSLGQQERSGVAAAAVPAGAHGGLRSPGRIPPRARVSTPIPPRWGPLATAVVGGEGVPPPSPKRARKKLSVLLVLMAVAMVLAALAVWKFVLPKVVVQGTIRYEGATRLRGEQRDLFQRNQLDLLADDKVRATAEALFRTRQPKAAGFFVEQDFRHPQLRREWVIDGERCDLRITYQGSNPTLDADRLSCLLQAIYDANGPSVSGASAATKTADQKRLAVVNARAEVAKVRERKASLAAIVRPDAAELSAAQAAVDKLDQAWTEALGARKAIAADVDRLQQPAESATAGAASDGDSSLKLMSEKLTALNGRLAEAKSAAAKQAADARKSLNSSIDEFQSSLGVAQGMMKDNPALASYISSAQKLHEASWKLQGDLIERQERQQKQLVEYKKRLEEQVETRKRDVMEKDEDLKELSHLLELKSREVNALTASGGLKREVENLRGEMQYIGGRITSRKVALGEDKFYSDAIGGLKQIIDSVQKQLDADRGASEKLMNDLETKFRNTSPEIETLPAAQRSLAARLAGQVDAMQAARKNYSEAVQSQDADANARLKELQAQAGALESEIALRRKEVSAEQQKKLTEHQAAELKKKQGELAEAEKAERGAREAYRQKIKELDLLVDRDRAYQSTREESLRLAQVDEPTKAEQLAAAERALAVAQAAADSSVAPQQPTPARVLELEDNRALYVTGAVLVVGLVFGSLVFFTVHSEPRHRHAAAPNGAPATGKPVSD